MPKKKTSLKKSTPLPPKTPVRGRPATQVDSIRHKESRKNIPTEELRDFVRDEELAQLPGVLYPRDPSLDPQLVWKGKDQQDQSDLAVPVVPIYIQEKIHPQAIINDLPKAKTSGGGGQTDLFADFNGLPEDFSDRIDFYHHEGHWSNRMILGDSLMVMTSLAEKEGLKGKVQTIYLDPPYGIKFGSNWQVSTRKRDVKDGKAEDASRQPEQVRAFRDTWKLGIHSYLAYLRDRLTVARDLLTETGSIFVQIGDENVHLVRCVMDEVFGSENFAGLIAFATTTGRGSTLLGQVHDYIVWYGRDIHRVKYRQLYAEKERGEAGATRYDNIETSDGERRRITPDERQGLVAIDKTARFFSTDQITSAGETATGSGDLEFEGRTFKCPRGLHWKTTDAGMRMLMVANRMVAEGNLLRYVRFLEDFPVTPLTNNWPDIGGVQSRSDPKVYVVQTSASAIQRCLLMTTDPGDLVLDPTCGSGTTAYVAEQWGRRWITCDTSRVALALARTRLMAGRFPYYYPADDYPGAMTLTTDDEIKAYLRKTAPAHVSGCGTSGGQLPGAGADIRKGFVYKRVPHVTLKSIANNPDIKEGMSRKQIDAAIAKHAETETLYDQPYEDNKTVRVTGPFTVESLSPHRTISVEAKKELAEKPTELGFTMKIMAGDSFTNTILENLRKAGIQNTVKGERLKFDSLDVYGNPWIHAEGRYTEKAPGGGKEKRAAICIGPEHGTVGAGLVKEAAKEAVKGVGFDVLIVCGFAFDPSVSEETKRYGKLTVLAARMNPDLAMGDELLKKTGAGNLFMVFGEPDVEITKAKDEPGKMVVEVKGVDVYDPTTGEIRSSSTDDIACWFIDTNYNGESFFVRHAYFTGAEEPYDKLKRALRAEIDEAAWSSLYSTVSRAFDKPETGKIAVKVINHYGDEVLKVFEVGKK
ncbi:MAG: site-specific DNA-methyltransferase [Phycisphaeraceae bacterium]